MACLVLRRAKVPEATLRGTLSNLVLHRRVPRAAHPTRRLGHPLPAIAMALYHAKGLREQVLAWSRQPTEQLKAQMSHATSATLLDCTASTHQLAKVFERMESDDGDISGGVCLGEWTNELAAMANQAATEPPLFEPADWYRLANFVLSSLPDQWTKQHLGGFSSIHRYVFLDCHHELEELDDSALVQGASADGASSLFVALSAERGPLTSVNIQCPLCHRIGSVTHAEIPVLRLAPNRVPPSTLWILLFRNDPRSDGLLRHPVDIPLDFGLDPDGTLKPTDRGTCAHLYELYAVLLFFNKRERGDPPGQFPGDSGGRFSLALYLGPGDGFYWIQDDKKAIPLRGHAICDLIHRHSHAALYTLSSS